jgi:hypothetical protein
MRWLPLCLVAACTLPNMPVQPTLVRQQPYSRSVLSRGDVSFGSFHVAGFSSAADSQSERSDVLPEFLRHGSGWEDYSFRVEEDGQPPRAVRCSAEANSTSLHSGRTTVTSTSRSLRCALWLTPGSPELARLELGDDGHGSLAAGGRTFAIEARNIQGKPDSVMPAGYAVTDGATELVVVQHVNGGAVWLAPNVTNVNDRALYAAAAAALLLYEPSAAQP